MYHRLEQFYLPPPPSPPPERNGSYLDSDTRDHIFISGDKIRYCEIYMSLRKLANCYVTNNSCLCNIYALD
jgi:hypothetical protein